MDNAQLPSNRMRRPWWLLPLLLGLVLLAIVSYRIQDSRTAAAKKNRSLPEPIAANDPRPKVKLTLDFGDGRRTDFASIAWREGMTVADLMDAWPNIEIEQKGSGQLAFVAAIDHLANQGADARNWMYSVNGKMADRSFAVYVLQPGDHVLWTFGRQQ
jgi:hypothetical protein